MNESQDFSSNYSLHQVSIYASKAAADVFLYHAYHDLLVSF